MRNESAWPQQCWKSCANGSNIVALRFGDHGTKEMLGVVGWKVWPVSNFVQQHATTSKTCNRVCKRTQHVNSNRNVGSCWPTMLRPFARGFKYSPFSFSWSLNRLKSKTGCRFYQICNESDNYSLYLPFWHFPVSASKAYLHAKAGATL